MPKKLLPILISLTSLALLNACTTPINADYSHSPSEQQPPKRAIIIDTDMAIDDWTAILYTLQHPSANVVAISVTGAGEAYCAEGMRNVMHLIQLADKQDKQIKVACGDSEPLDGFNVFPQQWRDDVNRLYGLPIANNLPAPLAEHAVSVLSNLLDESSVPVDIIALGNLTNIAQLILEHPSSINNIGKLYIMGGAFNTKGNIIVPGFTDDNLNQVAEWNMYVDPLAAKIVFDSDVNKSVVPLDATNKVRVTHEFAKKLKSEAHSKAAKFKDKILDKNTGFIASDEYYFWDPLTAVYALNPDLCETENHFVTALANTADNAGPNTQAPYSATNYDGKPRNILDPKYSGRTVITASGNGRKSVICMTPDAERFKRLLIDGLNASDQ